jgi:hypothetical protein
MQRSYSVEQNLKMITEDDHVNIMKAETTAHLKTAWQTAHTGRH